MNTLQEVRSVIAPGRSLSLNEAALGSELWDRLQLLFNQASFVVDGIANIATGAAPLQFSGSVNGLFGGIQPYPVTVVLFDLASGTSAGQQRQCMILFDLPAAVTLQTVFDFYRGNSQTGSGDVLQLFEQLNFRHRKLLFSSFDWSSASDVQKAAFPAAFAPDFQANNIRSGINCAFDATINSATGDVLSLLNVNARNHAMNGLIALGSIYRTFVFSVGINAAPTLSRFEFDIDTLAFEFPLIALPFLAPPVVVLSGRIGIQNKAKFRYNAQLDMRAKSLGLRMFGFPSFAESLELLGNGETLQASQFFPVSTNVLGDIAIRSIDIGIQLPAGTGSMVMYHFGMAVGVQHPIAFVDGIAIEPLLQLAFSYPFDAQRREYRVALVGRWLLGQTLFYTQFSYPDFTFSAQMVVGHYLDFSALANSMLKGVHLPPSISLVDMRVEADFRQKSFTMFLDVGGDWGIDVGGHSFAFRALVLALNYAEQKVQTGSATGRFTILDYHFELSASYNQGDWLFTGTTLPGERIVLSDLLQKFRDVFGTEGQVQVPEPFRQLSIDLLYFNYLDSKTAGKQFAFYVSLDHLLTISDVFSIDVFFVRIETANNRLNAQAHLQINIGGAVLFLDATGGSDGWLFQGQTEPGQNIQISHVLQKFGLPVADLPAALQTFSARNVAISFNTANKNFHFTFEGQVTDPVAAQMTVQLDLKKRPDGQYDKYFSGQLKVGTGADERIFDVIFRDKLPVGSPTPVAQLLGLYRKPGGENIPLNALLNALFRETVSDVPNLDFKVKDAMFVLTKENGVNKYLFTSDMDFGIDLSGLGHLPLIGRALPANESLRLSFQPIFTPSDAARQLSAEDIQSIVALIPEGGPHLPTQIKGGFALLSTLRIGNITQQINIGVDTAQTSNQLGSSIPPLPGSSAPLPVALPPDPANTQWVNLQKSFGPLNLARIGLGYQNGKIAVVLDASFSMGPLELALLGLGARYDLSTKELSFRLDGLGLEFKKGPLELSGMFLRMGDDFAGRASLRMGAFGLVALGAYGELRGEPSMFIYAFLNYPLGGPVFFFVEGLALGFGYNRRFIAPPIEQIHTFPLIAEATGTAQPAPGLSKTGQEFATAIRQEFAVLEHYLPPELGSYFLAAGIKFNSFKIIDSFALLSVGFGRSLSFTLMGVSKLSIPDAGKGSGTIKVAEVELAFVVAIDPEEGFFAARANLTPNSYLFSNLCRIQGGFAFYTWFKGQYSGDFVVTLGGYHPHYAVPAHYPQPASVPRLSYMWRLSDALFIKGEAYFALTPKAMMLGGRLEARFHLDTSWFAVNAWFVANADFLVYWKPFHYEGNISVEIGAEFVVHAFWGDVHIGLNVGADLELWGPDFAGIAHIKAKVCFIDASFDIKLGNTARQAPPKIGWEDFKKSFLPANLPQTGASIQLLKGLLRSLAEGGSERWIVNPKTVALQITSVAAFTQQAAYYTGVETGTLWDASQSVALAETGTPGRIGIDPMGLADFQSKVVIRLLYKEQVVSQTTFNEKFSISPVYKQFPKALWTNQLSKGAVPEVNGPQMTSAIGGYVIAPKTPPKSSNSHIFPVKNLEFDQSTRNMPKKGLPPLAFRAAAAGSTFAKAFADTNAGTERAKILRELGFDPIPETNLSDDFPRCLIRPPVLTT
jgi:hypothetical protein